MANSTIFSGVKITWFGHASVLLEADGLSIYVDPFVLPKNPKPADVILYTHGHFDHCVAAPSITTSKTIIIGHGCSIPGRVIEIGGIEKVNHVLIKAVDAYNIGKPFHPKEQGAGFLIKFRTATVYIAGDTDFIPEMKTYKCDVALLPIGGKYTMDAKEAALAVASILPKVAIPIHYNYLEDTKANPEEFKAEVEKLAGQVNVRILSP
jgi:L-ascorbate metabolism protein UlaG (beta-lactamase superfamily)